MSTSLRVIDSPSPEPPICAVSLGAFLRKRLEHLFLKLFGHAYSVISNRKFFAQASAFSSTFSMMKSTRPLTLVNFTAFDSRFISIWRILTGSTLTASTPDGRLS
jgi:hypothetical protein